MRSQKNYRSRRNSKNQRGGDGNHNIQSVGFPYQYYNPGAPVPAYYPEGHDVLTKTYQSSLGPIRAVNTTQPNATQTEMGPSLAPFSPYEDLSHMVGGGAFEQIVNPLTNRKVNVRSKLGQQIIQQYLKRISQH